MEHLDKKFISADSLTLEDIDFIVRNFGHPNQSFSKMLGVVRNISNNLEEILESDWLYNQIIENKENILTISPFLMFSVLLRRAIPGPYDKTDRHTINYIANMLSNFCKNEALYKVHPQDHDSFEHLIDLRSEERSCNQYKRFFVQSHIGNYSLFMSGLFTRWFEYRHQYKNRPLKARDYALVGKSYFIKASNTTFAKNNKLRDVFIKLGTEFDKYRFALNQISNDTIFVENYV